MKRKNFRIHKDFSLTKEEAEKLKEAYYLWGTSQQSNACCEGNPSFPTWIDAHIKHKGDQDEKDR